jgi:hypothetical protein
LITTANDATFNFGSDNIIISDGYINLPLEDPDLIPYVEGNIYYDVNDHTLAVQTGITDVTLQVGQETIVRVVNNTTNTITNGTVVYLNGVQGNRPTIALAVAYNTTLTHAIGLVTHDILSHSEGFVTTLGLVRGVDTTGWTEGDKLFVSSTTPGQLVNSKPSGKFSDWFIGWALNSTVNGSIFVQPHPMSNLADLHDVNYGVPIAGNHLLGIDGYWNSQSFSTDLISAIEANTSQWDLSANLNLATHALLGATTIGSTYFTTTANDATFNFGSNDIVIGDGYIKASGSTLQTYIGNTSELTLNATEFCPTTDSHTSLGITEKRWSNCFTDAATIETLTSCTTASITTANITTGVFATVAKPDTNNGADLGETGTRWNNIYGTTLNLNGTISGATTIGSTYFTTTPNDATFNFGSNDVVIGDGYIKASGSTLQNYIGSTSKLTLTSDTLRPSTNGTLTLGDGSYGFLGARFYNPSGCAITLKSGTTTNSYINFGDTDSISQGRLLYVNSTDLFLFRVNDTDELVLSSTALYPHANDGLTLGSSSLRWSEVYATNGTIETSDERKKQDILPIDDDVLTAWGDVSLVFFRWIDAVNEKGDDARIHSGFISQRIRDAFAAHGLDAHRYGLFCYDQWEEKVDNEGNVIQSAGDAYGIRITECLAVEAAYQRRRADQIEERLTTIEKLLNI